MASEKIKQDNLNTPNISIEVVEKILEVYGDSLKPEVFISEMQKAKVAHAHAHAYPFDADADDLAALHGSASEVPPEAMETAKALFRKILDAIKT